MNKVSVHGVCVCHWWVYSSTSTQFRCVWPRQWPEGTSAVCLAFNSELPNSQLCNASHMFVAVLLFQASGLQYKRFLAFPWILTVTWPLDTVSQRSDLWLPPPLVLLALRVSFPPFRTVPTIPSRSRVPTAAGSTPSSATLCRCWWLSVSAASYSMATWWTPSSLSWPNCPTLASELSDTRARSQVEEPQRKKNKKNSQSNTRSHTQSLLYFIYFSHLDFLSGQAAQRFGGRGPGPKRWRREQPETVRRAESQDAAAEKRSPAEENAEEDHRGEPCVSSFKKKKNWTKFKLV